MKPQRKVNRMMDWTWAFAFMVNNIYLKIYFDQKSKRYTTSAIINTNENINTAYVNANIKLDLYLIFVDWEIEICLLKFLIITMPDLNV